MFLDFLFFCFQFVLNGISVIGGDIIYCIFFVDVIFVFYFVLFFRGVYIWYLCKGMGKNDFFIWKYNWEFSVY